MFRRDASGPMDVDADSVHPLGRAAEYALMDDDGPARKRPHSDLASGLAPPAHTPAFRFGPNTPFLFHAQSQPTPAPKFEPYDPNKWARTDFGLGTTVHAGGVDDVDMDGMPESPRGKKSTVVEKGNEKEGDEGKGAEEFPDERKIATGAVTRTRRRRKQQQKEDNRISRSEHHYNVHMTPQGTRHSEVPAILLGYVQVLFNSAVVLGFIYVALNFVLAVKRDVQERIEEYSVEYLQEISECSRAYLTNRCEAGTRVPAMEAACQGWELCMNRDPRVVGRARVGAETFAGVINSFFDHISWKTMIFTVVSLSLFITLINSALFNLRAKQREPTQQAYPHPAAPWMYQGYGHMGQGQLGMGLGQMGMGGGPEDREEGEKSAGAKALGWFSK